MKKIIVNFMGFVCDVVFLQYREDNGTAIQLIDTEDGSPIAKVTICTLGQLTPDLVAIKNYGECVGMPEALIEAGLIGETPVASIAIGYVNVPIYKLKVKPE